MNARGSQLTIGLAAERVRRVRAVIQRARWGLSGGESPDMDACVASMERLSQELLDGAMALGLDSPLARHLLSLREALDSHTLTATAIAGCEVADSATSAMVRRGIDAVDAGLPAPTDPIVTEGQLPI